MGRATDALQSAPDPAVTFSLGGWRHVGFTERRHRMVYQLLPPDFPPPVHLPGSQIALEF